jgi:hypothetical protein
VGAPAHDGSQRYLKLQHKVIVTQTEQRHTFEATGNMRADPAQGYLATGVAAPGQHSVPHSDTKPLARNMESSPPRSASSAHPHIQLQLKG